MEIYNIYKEPRETYKNWNEAIHSGSVLIKNIEAGRYANPFTLKDNIRKWQLSSSDLIKSKGIKDDLYFSKDLISEYSFEVSMGSYPSKQIRELSSEAKLFINERISILRTLRDSDVKLPSTEKLFDLIDGTYFHLGKPIQVNNDTYGFVFFDATYKLREFGGEITYKELKDFLMENKITLKKKKFTLFNLKELKSKVQDNLLSDTKGFLLAIKISNFIDKDKKRKIFRSIQGQEKYYFDNNK